MLPKKKGRKPKSYYENLKLQEMSNNILIISISGGIESECKDDFNLDISKIVGGASAILFQNMDKIRIVFLFLLFRNLF